MNSVSAAVSDAVGRELAGEQGPPCLRVKCVDVVRRPAAVFAVICRSQPSARSFLDACATLAAARESATGLPPAAPAARCLPPAARAAPAKPVAPSAAARATLTVTTPCKSASPHVSTQPAGEMKPCSPAAMSTLWRRKQRARWTAAEPSLPHAWGNAAGLARKSEGFHSSGAYDHSVTA